MIGKCKTDHKLNEHETWKHFTDILTLGKSSSSARIAPKGYLKCNNSLGYASHKVTLYSEGFDLILYTNVIICMCTSNNFIKHTFNTSVLVTMYTKAIVKKPMQWQT